MTITLPYTTPFRSAEALGERRPLAPTATVPRRRVPLPAEADPHAGHAGHGAAAGAEPTPPPPSPAPTPPGPQSALAPPVFDAVRAGSCAAAVPRARR